jgi:hypothetical protein
MPSTRYNVALLSKFNPTFSWEEIAAALNEVHNQCMSQNLDAFLVKDPITGMPPYLITQSGVFEYPAPDDCRQVCKLFVDPGYYRYVSSYTQGTALQNTASQIRAEEFTWMGQIWLSLPWIYSTPAIGNIGDPGYVAPIIGFGGNWDPGTTVTPPVPTNISTQNYYLLYWKKPNQILTPDDVMQLPDELMADVRRAVNEMLSVEDYGNTGSDLSYMEQAKKVTRMYFNRTLSGRTSVKTKVGYAWRDNF